MICRNIGHDPLLIWPGALVIKYQHEGWFVRIRFVAVGCLMTPKVRALQQWPWLLNRYLKLWLIGLTAPLLGVFAIAAVGEIDCRTRPSYLLSTNGDRIMLAEGGGFSLIVTAKMTASIRKPG